MSIPELPAIEWLGYSIDLSRSPTMDLRAVSPVYTTSRCSEPDIPDSRHRAQSLRVVE